jgi:alpha-tubulin suppressor-like RCC1 family protein
VVTPTGDGAVPPAPAGWPATLSIADDNGCFTRGGQVLCWGDNEYGQLGDAAARSRDEAAPIAGIDDAVDVALLGSWACALRRGGEVVCWGRNEPMHTLLTDATDLSSSLGHACALRRNGKVACWGFSTERAHGNARESVDEATDVEGVTDAQAIAVSYAQSCALRRGGALLCWGAGIDASDQADWVPVPVPGGTDLDALWGGTGSICVRRRAGEVACLERARADDYGTYDDEDRSQKLRAVEDWAGARQIATVADGACAVLPDARVSCRGGSSARSSWWIAPLDEARTTTVDDTDGTTAVAASARLCTLDAAGLPRCRGVATFYRAQAVAIVDDATMLAGGDNGVCVRRRSQAGLWCWGAFNALGSKASQPEPPAGDLPDAAQVHVDRTLCVVDRKAQLSCGYGFDFKGSPTLTRVKQYATIGFHACAVRTDGTVSCWGYNSKGELGDGTTTPAPEKAPVQVRGLRDVVEVVAGYMISCARLRSGAVHCWGTGATDRFPEGEIGIDDAVELDAATNFVCARRRSGKVTCWGSVYDLDSSRRYDTVGPIDLPGVADAVDVDAGDHDVCVARADGSVACAGRVTGRLDRDPPLLRLDGFDDAVAVTTGDRFVCALRRGGGVRCLGNNHYGSVGDGSAEAMRPVPLRLK